MKNFQEIKNHYNQEIATLLDRYEQELENCYWRCQQEMNFDEAKEIEAELKKLTIPNPLQVIQCFHSNTN